MRTIVKVKQVNVKAKTVEETPHEGKKSCTRKAFIVGSSSFAACGGLFADSLGMASRKSPNLRLGVLSDIHFLLEPKTRKLRKDWDAATFVHALEDFRERNVDAVVVAGDLAESGIVAELQFVMDAWQSVFPQDRGADGRKVERLFIYGNHDIDAPFWAGAGSAKRIAELYPDEATRKRQIIATDRKAAWEKVFREPYETIWTKTVKGYTFFGAHWGGDAGTPGVRDFLVREAAKLNPKKPFFFIQHPHLRGTCYGDWAGGHDDGSATRALERFPNAVAFSGHSHYALTDERSVWQGAFTSIGTGSLRYAGQPNCQFPEGFENTMSGRMMRADENDSGKMMGLFWGNYSVRHGMVASVYDDRIVLERRDFLSDKPLGDDWIVPLPATAGGDYSFTKRRARHPAPQFAAGAVVKTSDGTAKNRAGTSLSAVTVTFPPANASKGRAYYYEVVAVDEEGGERITKRILSEGWCDPVGGSRYAKNVSCAFAKAELPKVIRSFRVRPVGFFGAKGRAIESGG